MKWRIVLTPAARTMLAKISDRRILEAIGKRIDGLSEEPEKQGKPLGGELAGFRSLRTVGQRYRIIYRVERGKVIVVVVAVGLRRENDRTDIYELAKKLLKLRIV